MPAVPDQPPRFRPRLSRGLAGALVLLLIPALTGALALHVRSARGPFWLAANQDPAYPYLLDSLRVATGLPPHIVQHPGTPAQMFGAAVLRLTHPTRDSEALSHDVLADPEACLLAVSTALLGLYVATSFLCGWVALRVTRRLGIACLMQTAPLLCPALLVELADVKPEPLLFAEVAALALVVLVIVARGASPPRAALVVGLGVLSGLAVATKFTALPLLLVGALLAGSRSLPRFLLSAALAFLAGVAPIVLRLGTAAAFLYRSASGPGDYGTGLFSTDGAAALVTLGPQTAIPGVVLVLSAAVGLLARASAWSRALKVVCVAEAAQLALLMLQPLGGMRYLLPALALLPLNLVLARLAVGHDERRRLRRASAAAVLVGVAAGVAARDYGRSVSALAAMAAQQGRAASVAAESGCRVVNYHASSAVVSALLFGHGRSRSERETRTLEELESLYPSACFVGYFGGKDWRFLPAGPMNVPRFMDFLGPIPAPRLLAENRCLVFQGSSCGPGRRFRSRQFSAEGLPITGEVEMLYLSAEEAVFRIANPRAR